MTWAQGATPAKGKRGPSCSTSGTDERHYNDLLPHLRIPGGLFSISDDCVGSSVDLNGQNVFVILGPEHARYATEPSQALPKGTPALHLGPTQITYKNRGTQVSRLAHEFLITGRKWIISDLQWIQSSHVAEESEEE